MKSRLFAGIMQPMPKPARVLVALWISCATGAAVADEPGRDARLSCRREAGPGRVLCELEVEVASGRLVWADALVREAPKFARPLRSRIGPKSASATGPRRIRLPIALAATENGRARLSVEARAVSCRAAQGYELCRPWSRVVRAKVEVGLGEQGPR